MVKEPSEVDKFKEAARQLETDDDPEALKERIRELAKKRDHRSADGRKARAIERVQERKAAKKVEEDDVDERVRNNLKDHGA